jgi:hypothetical protein
MSTDAITPLRQRMIEDMSRGLRPRGPHAGDGGSGLEAVIRPYCFAAVLR